MLLSVVAMMLTTKPVTVFLADETATPRMSPVNAAPMIATSR